MSSLDPFVSYCLAIALAVFVFLYALVTSVDEPRDLPKSSFDL